MPLTDRDKRTLRTGGIILGVLLVAFVLFKVLTGGGGEEAISSSPPLRTSAAPGGGQTTETPSLTPSPVLVLPLRDPFSIPPGFPVSPAGSSSPGTTSPGATSPGATSPGATSPGATTPGTTSSSTRTPTADTATAIIGGHTITLLDTSSSGAEQASVEVDATVYHPSAGQSFGPNRQYMLQSVSGTCATFLFGDEAFTLCVPQNK
jgi:hypothetical protein